MAEIRTEPNIFSSLKDKSINTGSIELLSDGDGLELFADGGLLVVAGHVVVLDAVAVKVVEDGEAALVALAVVGLSPIRPAKKKMP